MEIFVYGDDLDSALRVLKKETSPLLKELKVRSSNITRGARRKYKDLVAMRRLKRRLTKEKDFGRRGKI